MLWFCTAIVFALQVSMTIFVYSIQWAARRRPRSAGRDLNYLLWWSARMIATHRFNPAWSKQRVKLQPTRVIFHLMEHHDSYTPVNFILVSVHAGHRCIVCKWGSPELPGTLHEERVRLGLDKIRSLTCTPFHRRSKLDWPMESLNPSPLRGFDRFIGGLDILSFASPVSPPGFR